MNSAQDQLLRTLQSQIIDLALSDRDDRLRLEVFKKRNKIDKLTRSINSMDSAQQHKDELLRTLQVKMLDLALTEREDRLGEILIQRNEVNELFSSIDSMDYLLNISDNINHLDLEFSEFLRDKVLDEELSVNDFDKLIRNTEHQEKVINLYDLIRILVSEDNYDDYAPIFEQHGIDDTFMDRLLNQEELREEYFDSDRYYDFLDNVEEQENLDEEDIDEEEEDITNMLGQMGMD